MKTLIHNVAAPLALTLSVEHSISARFTVAKVGVVEYMQSGETSRKVCKKLTFLYYARLLRNDIRSGDGVAAFWESMVKLLAMRCFTLLMPWKRIFRPRLVIINRIFIIVIS